MTDLAPVEPTTPAVPDTPFDVQWRLCQRIARTEFVPAALRNRPEAVLAAVLSGQERGLGPMESLSSIHVIEGKPNVSAEMMRALVHRAGHRLDIELTADACTITGTRRDDGTALTVTFTMDDARQAGVAGKDVWRKYPRAMLAARATSLLCGLHFPDVVRGLSYTPEELGRDAIDVDAWTPDADAPLVDPATGEIVGGTAPQVGDGDTSAVPPAPPTPTKPSHAQLAKMGALSHQLGYSDKAARLSATAARLGHPVESWNDLTPADAHTVIDAWQQQLDDEVRAADVEAELVATGNLRPDHRQFATFDGTLPDPHADEMDRVDARSDELDRRIDSEPLLRSADPDIADAEGRLL